MGDNHEALLTHSLESVRWKAAGLASVEGLVEDHCPPNGRLYPCREGEPGEPLAGE